MKNENYMKSFLIGYLKENFSAGLETFGLQILGESELNPELSGDMRFVDAETGETLDVSAAADLLGINRNTLRKKIRELDIPVTRGKTLMQ